MMVTLTMGTQVQQNLYHRVCPIFNAECTADIVGVGFGVRIISFFFLLANANFHVVFSHSRFMVSRSVSHFAIRKAVVISIRGGPKDLSIIFALFTKNVRNSTSIAQIALLVRGK